MKIILSEIQYDAAGFSVTIGNYLKISPSWPTFSLEDDECVLTSIRGTADNGSDFYFFVIIIICIEYQLYFTIFHQIVLK